MTEHAVEISIVVATYNQSEMLKRLLASFEQLEAPEKLEVIIVDDCSPDDTGGVASAWCSKPLPFPARFIRLEQNSGPGRGRNEGAKAARGRVVAFTDTDCVVTPSWPHKLAEKLDEEKRIVGVGGHVQPLANDNWVAEYATLHGVLEPPKDTVLYLITCNCCYLREPLLEVGGFSGDIPKPGGEDIEASILLWKQGWRFIYAPDALVYHDFRGTLRGFGRTWYNYGMGCSIVAHRQLTPQELYPEWGRMDVENYWYGKYIRPAVTGVRSFFGNLGYHYRQALAQERGPRFTFMILVMWFICRVQYLRGWNEGMRRALAATGRSLEYFSRVDESAATYRPENKAQ